MAGPIDTFESNEDWAQVSSLDPNSPNEMLAFSAASAVTPSSALFM